MQNCSPGSRPEVPKKKSPSGGWGARGAGAFDLRDKNSSRTAGIMIDERIGSLPYELNWIACIPLLLPLFGKQVEDCLSDWIECF